MQPSRLVASWLMSVKPLVPWYLCRDLLGISIFVTGNIGEWWQWLYELLEADPGKQLGAHLAYKGRKAR